MAFRAEDWPFLVVLGRADAVPDLVRRAAELAAPTPGTGCAFVSVDDERHTFGTYPGRIGGISEDGHFRVSIKWSLPEYHTPFGSPVVVARGSDGADHERGLFGRLDSRHSVVCAVKPTSLEDTPEEIWRKPTEMP